MFIARGTLSGHASLMIPRARLPVDLIARGCADVLENSAGELAREIGNGSRYACLQREDFGGLRLHLLIRFCLIRITPNQVEL